MPFGSAKTSASAEASSADATQPGMRQRIKSLAASLLIQHGYRGVSFGDIAEALPTTRANIHYHFGNKNALVEEVTDEYVTATLDGFRSIWTNPDTSLEAKVDATIAFNRKRYDLFNAGGDRGQSWSLIARMRADSDALSPRSVASVRRFASELTGAVTSGVANAVSRGELSAGTPVKDLVLQLVGIVNSAGPITQDAASFDQLERIYRAFLRTALAAYGAPDRHPAPKPAKKRPAAASSGSKTGSLKAAAAGRKPKARSVS
jgi:TetR/AcrR family transcriptional regulator, transcriptional repressor for nem operon